MTNMDCPKCKGTGRVRDEDGTVHTCWDCLRNDNLDQHSEDLRETKIKF